MAGAAAASATGSVNQIAALIDLDDPAAIDHAARAFAVDYADKRAGELIDGLNATTTDALRGLVSQALASNWSVDTFADRIEQAGLFTDYRAEMIARTEISMAQNAGALAAGKEAAKAGAKLKKAWRTADNPCPICEAAEAMGEIDLDADFGDAGDAPPPHPNCECELELVSE